MAYRLDVQRRSLAVAMLISVALQAGAAAVKAEAPADPGPHPATLDDYRAKGQAALASDFHDPASVQFRWDRWAHTLMLTVIGRGGVKIVRAPVP